MPNAVHGSSITEVGKGRECAKLQASIGSACLHPPRAVGLLRVTNRVFR